MAPIRIVALEGDETGGLKAATITPAGVGPSCVAKQGDQTDQESRSAGHEPHLA